MKFDLATAGCNVELEVLSRRYAAAMDRRDRTALLSVFDADASMRVERPGREAGTLRGHDEIGRLVEIIARWPRTLHIVAQGLYQLDARSAYGEVYCTAHHFDLLDKKAGRDHIMYILYVDRYRLDRDDRWRINHRTVLVEATEDRPVQVGNWAADEKSHARGYRTAAPST
jgi:hypothetical protein